MKDVPEPGGVLKQRKRRSVKNPLARAEKMLVRTLQAAERLEGTGHRSRIVNESVYLPETMGAATLRAPRKRSNEERRERTLTLSIIEGTAYSVMVGLAETYFVPYALFLGGSNLLLGLFVALPIFTGSVSQLFSESLLGLLGTRKRVIATGVFVQALLFVPMILVHAAGSLRAEMLLVIVCVYWVCGLIVGPSWSSLIGDLVPETERGAYFSRRNRSMQITTFFGMVAGGMVLFLAKKGGAEMAGFCALFGAAAAARLISGSLILLHHEPPIQSPPAGRTLRGVADVFRNEDQRSLILYLTWMNLAVYMAAPFFSAYMLRSPEDEGLGWSYVTFTLIQGISVFFKFVFLPLWGRSADTFGSRKCLVLSAWLLCALPLVWLVPGGPSPQLAMIALAQVWGGFAWAGHELCAFNFLLDSAVPAERPRLVASMNIVNGFMVFLGSTLGAVVVSLAPSGLNAFLLVFLFSSAARFAVCATFAHRLREVRIVEKISYRSLFFRVSSVRATAGPVLRFFVLPARATPAMKSDSRGIDSNR